MLTIRLARTGRKKLANYRVVAADSRRAATGKFIAQLGHYNPYSKELVIDEKLTQEYLDKGAQPSSRVVKMLDGHKGIKLPEWAKKNLVVKAEKPKEEPEEKKSEEAPAVATDAEADKDESEEGQKEKKEDEKDKKPSEEEE